MLEEKTRNNLNDLIYSYDSLKNDHNTYDFFKDTIDIVNKDSNFNKVIINLCLSNKNISLATNKNIYHKEIDMYLNINNNQEFIKRHINSILNCLDLKFSNEYKINNVFYLSSLLHEVAHVKQIFYKYNLLDNKALHKLYKNILDDDNNNLYKVYPLAFSYERNANLESSNTLFKILDDNEYLLKQIVAFLYLYEAGIVKNNLNYQIGYEIKNNKILSPVERTFTLLNKKKKYTCRNISTKELFEHGLPISIENYNQILNEYKNTTNFMDAYNNIQNRFEIMDQKKLSKTKK